MTYDLTRLECLPTSTYYLVTLGGGGTGGPEIGDRRDGAGGSAHTERSLRRGGGWRSTPNPDRLRRRVRTRGSTRTVRARWSPRPHLVLRGRLRPRLVPEPRSLRDDDPPHAAHLPLLVASQSSSTSGPAFDLDETCPTTASWPCSRGRYRPGPPELDPAPERPGLPAARRTSPSVTVKRRDAILMAMIAATAPTRSVSSASTTVVRPASSSRPTTPTATVRRRCTR